MPKAPVLSLSSVVRVESQIHPGVFFVTRKMTDKRRIALNLAMAPIREDMDKLLRQIRALGDPPFAESEDLTDEQKEANKLWLTESTPLLEQYNELLNDEVYPRQLAWGLAKVIGLQVDDENGAHEITGANAAELLPPDLYDEAVFVVRETSGLGPKREGNSESPTTSSAVVDGRTPDTTA